MRKIDSLTNYNTNNSININLILENKIYKGEEMCLTDENQMLNKNRNENNAKRICCFLQNKACDEYQRILELHKNRAKIIFSKISPNIIETYKKEFENLVKLINSFSD